MDLKDLKVFEHKVISHPDNPIHKRRVRSARGIPKKIRLFIERVGLQLDYRRDDGIAYNGSKLAVLRCETLSDILHDLAHYQLASPERRTMKDYGLGASPDTYYKDRVHRVVSKEAAEQEEELASVLGIMYEYHFNVAPANTWKVHGWDSPGAIRTQATFVQALQKLITLNFLKVINSTSNSTGDIKVVPTGILRS